MVFLKEKSLSAYRKYNDRLLISLSNCGDLLAEHVIIDKYKKLVKMKARSYFLVGADSEDIIQEGMIGLYKAIRGFDESKLTSFQTFAEICIHRQMITAVKAASRQKHIPLNTSISLTQPLYHEDSNYVLLDILSVNVNDPMSLFLTQERLKEFKERVKIRLSKLEKSVLESYLEGKQYQEIALDIKKNIKSVDNALQRIKQKLELFLN